MIDEIEFAVAILILFNFASSCTISRISRLLRTYKRTTQPPYGSISAHWIQSCGQIGKCSKFRLLFLLSDPLAINSGAIESRAIELSFKDRNHTRPALGIFLAKKTYCALGFLESQEDNQLGIWEYLLTPQNRFPVVL